MKRRALKSLLAAQLLLCSLFVNAQEFKVDGVCYSVLYDTNYKVEVTGGEIKKDSTMVIPSTVTFDGVTYSIVSIKDYAFYNRSKLAKVKISSSVMNIGDNAFADCKNLKVVMIGLVFSNIDEDFCFILKKEHKKYVEENIIDVSMRAFRNTPWFDSLPNGPVYLGPILYMYKGKMPQNCEIVVEEGTLGINNDAFSGCYNLKSIKLPKSVKSIGKYAFSDCYNLKSIKLPKSVKSIGECAFSGCHNLKSIKLPKRITSIEYGTFALCSALERVDIPTGVTTIKSGAFHGCDNLKNIKLPKSITSIEKAFSGCSSLERIKIPEGVTTIKYETFYGCGNLKSAKLPGSVASIESGAFSGCSSLEKIYIPKGVTSIEESVFYGCESLSGIIVDDDNPVYDSRDNCNAIIETETSTLVVGCKGSVIPEGVVSIGNSAFANCLGLKSVAIPKSVNRIGREAFSNCQQLSTIVVDDDNPVYDSRSNCNAVIETATNILAVGCVNSVIPVSVTGVGDYAFAGCKNIEMFDIPEGVTVIGERAFSGCEELSNISLPKSLTTIGNGAFWGCCNLVEIELHENIRCIGESAFSYCGELRRIISHIPKERLLPINSSAFIDINEEYYPRLYVPKGSKDAYLKSEGWGYLKILER